MKQIILLELVKTKPNKDQVFEAFTSVIGYEYKYSDEIEALMLKTIQEHKDEYGTDYLHKVMTDTIWKKISRLFQL